MSLSGKLETEHCVLSNKSGWFFNKTARAFALSLCVAGAVATMSMKVMASSSLSIVADRAKIVRIAGEVGSVIVGNPSFADVSVQKKFIIIHGRNFGQTNILVLDENGESLADLEVTIVKGRDRNISVYRGGQKASYACAPKCESTLQVGDSEVYFATVKKSIETKMELAKQASQLTTK